MINIQSDHVIVDRRTFCYVIMPQVCFVDQSLIDFYMFNTQMFETCLVSSRIDE